MVISRSVGCPPAPRRTTFTCGPDSTSTVARHRLTGPEALSGGEHLREALAVSVEPQPQVDQTRAGDLGGAHFGTPRQLLGQPLGQVPRYHANFFARLQRHVGGVVTVLRVTWAVDRHRVRQRAGVETTVGQNALSDGSDQVGERGGGHPCESRER